MKRVYNFAAGPASLPLEVLEEVQKEILDYNNTGMSVMEMSHRSKMYEEILEDAKASLRKVLNVPSNYHILFLQGGASSQFAMVPLNLMKHKKAAFVISGHWATKAYEEAKKYGDCYIIGSSEAEKFVKIPEVDYSLLQENTDYIHVCWNNTIYGTKFYEYLKETNIPIVADMSSSILSEEIDVSKFGVIYAGAQKNIGPAGVTVVIIRDDLCSFSLEQTPTMFSYQTHISKNSMYNTPPTFGIYVCGKVFKWIEKQGGVQTVAKLNLEKANYLYNYLDNSLYTTLVEKKSRSLMNVTFTTGSDDLDKLFVEEAASNNLYNLKGHKILKGLRASIYNAVDIQAVKALVEYMKQFENKYLRGVYEKNRIYK